MQRSATTGNTRGDSRRFCPRCCHTKPIGDMRTYEPRQGWLDLPACKACLSKGRKSA